MQKKQIHYFLVGSFIIASMLLFSQSKQAFAASSNCMSPPSDVDHASFTNAELDLYGLPHRRSDQSLADWQHLVRDAKTRFCTPTLTTHSHYSKVGIESATNTTPYWSGYQTTGYGYSDVIGQWNVPCLTLKLTWGVASQWVGIGQGFGSDNLIQDGSETDEDSDFPGHWYQFSYAWYEDYPHQLVQQLFLVACGDTIYSSVYQDSSGIHYYLNDRSSGEYFAPPPVNNFLANGSTAEWIVERTQTSISTLADFNYVVFSQCVTIRNGYAYNINSLPNTIVNMVGSSNQIDAYPGSLGTDNNDIGNNFTDYWQHGN